MLEAYKKYRPDWYKALMEIRDVLDMPGEDVAIEEIYNRMEKGPTEEVTKHVMQSGDARIILLPFKWTDIGTWGSVYEFFVNGDGKGNYKDGHILTVDASGSLIKTSNEKKLIAVAGGEDMVIVDTDDILLVIPKSKIGEDQRSAGVIERTERDRIPVSALVSIYAVLYNVPAAAIKSRNCSVICSCRDCRPYHYH